MHGGSLEGNSSVRWEETVTEWREKSRHHL